MVSYIRIRTRYESKIKKGIFMIYDIQRASLGKRIMALILDFILIMTLIVGVAFLISKIVSYDKYSDELSQMREEYSKVYGVKLDITNEEYNAFSEEDKAKYDAADEAFSSDERAAELNRIMFNLMILIIFISPIVSYFLLEFLVPLFLGNGQTVGKKVFAIGVVHTNSVRLTSLGLFARSMLGKCTIGTMLPVMGFFMMIVSTQTAFAGATIILLICGLNIALLLFTKRRTPLHDILSNAVCVDMQTQKIFESAEQLVAYKAKLHEETVNSKRDD